MTRALAFALLLSLAACERSAQAGDGQVRTPASTELREGLARYETIRLALLEERDADAAAAAQALASLAGLDPELGAAATAVAEAAEIAGRRKAFGELSRRFVLRVAAASDLAPNVYVCPMVTDGYGYWLQPARGIGNPYMGPSMPRCGSESSLKAALKAAGR